MILTIDLRGGGGGGGGGGSKLPIIPVQNGSNSHPGIDPIYQHYMTLHHFIAKVGTEYL